METNFKLSKKRRQYSFIEENVLKLDGPSQE